MSFDRNEINLYYDEHIKPIKKGQHKGKTIIDDFLMKYDLDISTNGSIDECKKRIVKVLKNENIDNTKTSNMTTNKTLTMTTNMTTNKKNLIDAIFQPNSDGISEWISIEKLTENNLWSKKPNGNQRNGIFLSDKRYNWDSKRLNDKPTGKVLELRTIGFNKDKLKGHNRHPPREDIINHYKNRTCVFCRTSNILLDHKNDLYNDLRVLNEDTQKKEDFQPTCNACNLRKNKVMVKTKKENKRQPPPDMIRIPFGIDFTVGDETFNPDDINTMVGTYWYDPIEFLTKALKMKLKDKDEEILALKMNIHKSEE